MNRQQDMLLAEQLLLPSATICHCGSSADIALSAYLWLGLLQCLGVCVWCLYNHHVSVCILVV
jgi:hypothetical protein